MLFGSEEQINDCLHEAQQFAKQNNMKLVFGAMVGSVSKDLQYISSDYDTRFLYLREDYPEKVCLPWEMTEDELVKRYYPQNKVFEWIPFWELTSFLNFLYEPSFKNDFSVGLYNIVGWTIKSPFTWDPYGLKSKLSPILDLCFNKNFEISYHMSILKRQHNDWEKEKIESRRWLDSLHAAATIEWCIEYNNQPPIDIHSLLLGLRHSDLHEIVKDIFASARNEMRALANRVDRPSNLSSYSATIKSDRNEELSNYLKNIYGMVQGMELNLCPNEEHRQYVNDMLSIVNTSINEREDLIFDSEFENVLCSAVQ